MANKIKARYTCPRCLEKWTEDRELGYDDENLTFCCPICLTPVEDNYYKESQGTNIKEVNAMRIATFNVACMAQYRGELLIPDNIKDEDILGFVQDNLRYVHVTELEVIEDGEVEVTQDDMRDVYEANEDEVLGFLVSHPEFAKAHMNEIKKKEVKAR